MMMMMEIHFFPVGCQEGSVKNSSYGLIFVKKMDERRPVDFVILACLSSDQKWHTTDALGVREGFR